MKSLIVIKSGFSHSKCAPGWEAAIVNVLVGRKQGLFKVNIYRK